MGLLVLLGIFAACVIVGIPVAFALGIAISEKTLMPEMIR